MCRYTAKRLEMVHRKKDEKIGDIDTEWQTQFGICQSFLLSFLSLLEILPKIYTRTWCCDQKMCTSKTQPIIKTEFKAGPPQAIFVIFGRRFFIILFKRSWKNMKKDTTIVRMCRSDHLGDTKNRKRAPRLFYE